MIRWQNDAYLYSYLVPFPKVNALSVKQCTMTAHFRKSKAPLKGFHSLIWLATDFGIRSICWNWQVDVWKPSVFFSIIHQILIHFLLICDNCYLRVFILLNFKWQALDNIPLWLYNLSDLVLYYMMVRSNFIFNV